MLYRQVTTRKEYSKGKQQQHKHQYTVICLPACYAFHWQQVPQRHQGSAEGGVPPTGNPKESYPDGTVRAGKLIWSTTGCPGQHLDWTDRDECWNRYYDVGLKKKKKKSNHYTATHDQLRFLSPNTCRSGCVTLTCDPLLLLSPPPSQFYTQTVTPFGCVPVNKREWLITRSVQSICVCVFGGHMTITWLSQQDVMSLDGTEI